MLSVFQIPIIDCRSFTSEAESRLPKPDWPLPEAKKDFIRQFGVVHERRQGGVEEYAGEQVFCRASNAIRLKNETGIISSAVGTHRQHHRCIFRRFYFEGRSVGKLEIGFRCLTCPMSDSSQWHTLLHTIAQSQWIVGPRRKDVRLASPLVGAGDALAHLYLRSTTASDFPKRNVQEWWVRSGEPVLVVEFEADGHMAPPSQSIRVPLSTHAVDLYFQRAIVDGRKLNVWYLGHRDLEVRRLRQLRLHLLRFHAELQTLRAVLRRIAKGSFPIIRGTEPADELQEFLRDAVRLISKDERHGVDQKGLLEATRSFFDFVSAGERDSLLFKLARIRRNVLRSIEAQTEVGPNSSQQIVVLGSAQFVNAHEIKTNGVTMTNFNVKFGDYATVHGDLVVAQSIQDSFNSLQGSTTRDDLKTKLEELTKEVSEISQQLPAEVARQMAEDLNVLIKESTKAEPRRKWYELSSQGILEASGALGAASGKIIGLVKDVLTLLNGAP
jgi:hypothetical protein